MSTVKTSLPGGESVQINSEPQSTDPSTAPNVSPHAAPPSGKTVQVTITAGGAANIRMANPA